MNALLKSETLDVDGDVDLIELARRWNDPRLLAFLMGYLHRSSETAPTQVADAMEAVTEILDDQKVTALFEHYRDNASFEDFEVDENLEDEEESEDDEENGPDEVGTDETIEASDETDDQPTLTPEAARKARVEMLKRFIEAAEARMKTSPPK
jgi:hypothetical protein